MRILPGPSIPLNMILTLAAILYCFRIAVIVEKGIVGYGRMLEPIARTGEFGAAVAKLLLPDRLTLQLVELVARLM